MLVELEELGHALAFGHRLDGEAVCCHIHQKGYSSVQPFSIGKVEERMMQFAQANNVILASDELYMSAKQLQHSMRTSKDAKGLVIA